MLLTVFRIKVVVRDKESLVKVKILWTTLFKRLIVQFRNTLYVDVEFPENVTLTKLHGVLGHTHYIKAI